MKRFLPALLLAGAAWPQPADLVIQNARIWTGGEAQPWAEALAVRGELIVAVGTRAEIARRTGRRTRVVDAGGRLVTPGFNDAHIHFLSGSLLLSQVDLVGACTLEEMQHRVRDYANRHPDRPWIAGSGWEYACFPEGRIAHRQDLDAAVKDRPVYLRAYDGHSAWVNSAALRRAEVTRATEFNGFGEVVKDPQGEPSGWLKEGAQALVRRHLPQPTRDERLAALEAGMRMAARLGITSFQNASGDADELNLWAELQRRSHLTLRVAMAMSSGEATPDDVLAWVRLRQRYSGPYLKVAAVKFMIDGVIESHTAMMLEPYADNAESTGKSPWEPKAYRDAAAQVDKAGLQIYTHAIGDAGVRMALDAYEHARRVNGPRDARHRVEHIEIIHRDDLDRFAKLGVLASMEPIHADPATVDVWGRAVGTARLPLSFPWNAIERAGAMLVFSSDWPASISVDPIRGLHTAVNRRTTGGQPPEGWLPDQRVSVETALRAYTVNAAYAEFEETRKGRLAPGMLADFVVLSQDLFQIDPMKIHETRVLMTVFNGRQVWCGLDGLCGLTIATYGR